MAPQIPAPAPGDNPGITREDLARFRDELLALFSSIAPTPVRPVPFGRFAAEYAALHRDETHSRSTRSSIRQAMGIVADLAGPGATTADLVPELVLRFIAGRPPGQSAQTTNGLLRRIRAACNYAVKMHYLRASPFDLQKLFLRAGAPARRRHHGVDEIARVLELARRDVARKLPGSPSQWRARRLHALLAIVAYTGCRRNEALYLRVEDVDVPGRVIHIRPRVGHRLKTEASSQPVPMVDALAAVLAGWLPHLAIAPALAARRPDWSPGGNPGGTRDEAWVIPNAYRTGPWTGGPSGVGRPLDRIKRLGERCGVAGFTFQSLRHSWATHAALTWGLTDLQIQRVLRHTTVKTQEHYRHADLAALRDAVRGVEFGGEGGADPGELAPPVVPRPAAISRTPPPSAPPAPSRNPSKPGVWNGRKLDPEDVIECRELRDRGWNYSRLRARYGVSKSTLSAMLNGLTHRHV